MVELESWFLGGWMFGISSAHKIPVKFALELRDSSNLFSTIFVPRTFHGEISRALSENLDFVNSVLYILGSKSAVRTKKSNIFQFSNCVKSKPKSGSYSPETKNKVSF